MAAKSTSLTPKLRFPEFKDGPGWEEKPFAALYTFKPTNTLSRDKLNYQSGSIRNIHYGDIHTRFQTLFDLQREYVPFVTGGSAYDFDDNAFCAEGDLVFADASEDLNDVGKSIEVVALHGQLVVSGTHTILATRCDGKPIVGFGGYLFRSERMRQQIRREAQGAKVYGISSGRLADVNLCFPAKSAEQRKIAACLTSLDELVAAQGRKLEALKGHKKGLMQQLFPRQGETRPRLRFGEFRDAGEWDMMPFKKLYHFQSTNNYSRDQLVYRSGNVRNIHYGDIHTRFATTFYLEREEVPFVNGAIMSDDFDADAYCVEGDMIFADASEDLNDVGKSIEIVSLNGEQLVSGSHTILARPNLEGIAIGFGGYLFKSRSVRGQIEKEAQGTKVMQISPRRLADITLLLPHDKAEQQRIAACLSSLDDLIAAEAKKLNALKTFKKGLMQQLFPPPEGD